MGKSRLNGTRTSAPTATKQNKLRARHYHFHNWIPAGMMPVLQHFLQEHDMENSNLTNSSRHWPFKRQLIAENAVCDSEIRQWSLCQSPISGWFINNHPNECTRAFGAFTITITITLLEAIDVKTLNGTKYQSGPCGKLLRSGRIISILFIIVCFLCVCVCVCVSFSLFLVLGFFSS